MEQDDKKLNYDLEISDAYTFLNENYLEDEIGIKFIAYMAKCAQEFLEFFDEVENNKIYDEKIFPPLLREIASDHLSDYRKKFNLDIGMVREELFSIYRLMQSLLIYKFDNHDLCDAIDLRPHAEKVFWLCHSMPCKNEEYEAFKLLDY